MLIGIAGMVGSGKSTLTHALARRFGLQDALESVDDENAWLERFYAGGQDAMRVNALPLQLYFLATRFESMRRMRGAGGSWVLDRTWYEGAEVFDYNLVADPGAIEEIAARVRHRLELVLPQTELFPGALGKG